MIRPPSRRPTRHTCRVPRSSRVAVLVAAVALGASACTTAVTGVPLAAGGVINHDKSDATVDTSFINNTDGGEIDKLAGTVVKDVEKFWKDEFPATFNGQKWLDLQGGYYSVDTASPSAPTPPCLDKASDIENNAVYCPTADSIAWDRASLLPVLKDKFGEAAVMLVLAHEMGHAVQRRAGITPQVEQANPQKFPTILLEAQADCYAGTFVKWVTDGRSDRLSVDREALDPALEAMVAFRDAVGTSRNAEGAHGDAFDRVSSFQDGFEKGAKLCAGMNVNNRQFTARGFGSQRDAASGGNSELQTLVNDVPKDITEYLRKQVTGFTAPKLKVVDTDPQCAGDQGPIAYCPDQDEIDLESRGEVPKLHQQVGDWATGTILASRYGLAVLKAKRKPLTGEDAQKAALCIAGAYSGDLLSRPAGDFSLSPGDLDEGVQVLLRTDYPARDVDGKAPETGFDRVSDFRAGVVGGFKSCKI
jgi:predicted metalloprotease